MRFHLSFDYKNYISECFMTVLNYAYSKLWAIRSTDQQERIKLMVEHALI